MHTLFIPVQLDLTHILVPIVLVLLSVYAVAVLDPNLPSESFPVPHFRGFYLPFNESGAALCGAGLPCRCWHVACRCRSLVQLFVASVPELVVGLPVLSVEHIHWLVDAWLHLSLRTFLVLAATFKGIQTFHCVCSCSRQSCHLHWVVVTWL